MTDKTIWKFVLVAGSEQQPRPGPLGISMPQGAVVLSAGVQGDDIVVWAKVDPTAPRRYRDFYLAWTGHKATWPADYFIDTVQTSNDLVWHVFAVKGKEIVE